jgi:hypothetical protein
MLLVNQPWVSIDDTSIKLVIVTDNHGADGYARTSTGTTGYMYNNYVKEKC